MTAKAQLLHLDLVTLGDEILSSRKPDDDAPPAWAAAAWNLTTTAECLTRFARDLARGTVPPLGRNGFDLLYVVELVLQDMVDEAPASRLQAAMRTLAGRRRRSTASSSVRTMKAAPPPVQRGARLEPRNHAWNRRPA